MKSYVLRAFAAGSVATSFFWAGCAAEQAPSDEDVGTTRQSLTESCGQPMNGPVQGYDISEWQGTFDWKSAKANNPKLAFGYARVSYGANYMDKTFDDNWPKIKAAGLLRGAYQYFLPTEDVVKQAQIVIDKVGKLGDGDMPVQFDVEPTANERGGLSGSQIAAKMKQWLDLVEAGTGKRPLIYTNAYLWQDAIGSTDFGKYPLWMSNYEPPSGCPKINDGWTKWTIWQYTDSSGTLDKNVFNGTYTDLLTFAGGSSSSTSSDPYPLFVPLTSTDIDGDGKADACARAIRGVTCTLSTGTSFGTETDGPKWSNASGWSDAAYRETIQFGDVDGDGKADACGRGPNGVTCSLSDGHVFNKEIAGPAWSNAAGWSSPSSYRTIRLADIDGDGKQDLCGRASSGIVCARSNGQGFEAEQKGPDWSNEKGFDRPDQYATIQFADIDGDGRADVCARDAAGIVCGLADGAGFQKEVRGPAWSNEAGWNRVAQGSTIRFVDVDGDGRADVCGRDKTGIVCARSTGTSFEAPFQGPAWSDDSGWAKESSYRTIHWGDIDGDKKLDICGRTAAGIVCSRSTGKGFSEPISGPSFGDDDGWNQEKQYSTIALGDVNGDGLDDVCGRGKDGYACAVSKGSSFEAPFAATEWSDGDGFGDSPYFESIRLLGHAPRAKASTTAPGGDGGAPGEGVDGGGSANGGGSDPARTNDDRLSQSDSSGCGVTQAGASSARMGAWAMAAMALSVLARRRSGRRRLGIDEERSGKSRS